MTRQLPPRPNLEHLKNQAKALLAELRRQNPQAQLADAQHAIAREYGFPSWPKLHAHVAAIAEASAASPGSGAGHPLAGRWVVDEARSKRHPLVPFRGATMDFSIEGDRITVHHVLIDLIGREERSTQTLQADGEVHPVEGGYMVCAKWEASNLLDVVATRDGDVVGHGRYEVSADGLELIVSTMNARVNANGWSSEGDPRLVLKRA